MEFVPKKITEKYSIYILAISLIGENHQLAASQTNFRV